MMVMHCEKKLFEGCAAAGLALQRLKRELLPTDRLLARGFGILAALDFAHASRRAGSSQNASSMNHECSAVELGLC